MRETRTAVRRRFDVWNEVPLVPQLTGMSCWAAAAAMLVGWRDRVVVDPPDVARGAGRWQAYRGGLHPSDVEALASAWGLTMEADPTWTLEGLRRTLTRHGPVWLGEASPGLHSVVVAGMHGDGTPDGTFVRVNDPWPVGRGERYSLPWRTLRANFDAAGSLLGMRAHVLHAGGRGSSRTRVEETRVTRSRISLPPTREVAMRYGNGWSPHPEDYASAGGPTAVAAAVIPAGERYVNTTAAGGTDPLRGHDGSGENLYLVWNELPDDCRDVDVVVHLHGFKAHPPNAALTRIKAQASGVRLNGRTRPTLGIVPRGRMITQQEYQTRLAAWQALPEETRRHRARPRPDAYYFPALLAGNGAGLAALITWSLAWLAREVLRRQNAPGRSRLILTAHSGGGSPLNALLGWRTTTPAACDPHEVHVFDALYNTSPGIESWVAARLAADRALPAGSDLRALGGGLRIFYGGGTSDASTRIGRGLPAAGDPLRDAYRAEATRFDHPVIPVTFGPSLLQDVRATLALNPAPSGRTARGHSVDDGYPVVDAAALEADEYGPPEAGYDDAAHYPVAASLAVDDDVRAWLAGDAAARAPLAASVAGWIAATDRSGIELIADAARRRHFLSEVDWTRTDFPGNDQNRSNESDALFSAIARVVPERRVTSFRFHDVDRIVQPVPDETAYRLHPAAKDAYVRMRAAALADGVTLRIGSAWRSRATQAGIAARNTNPNAVAQRTSAHSYGLAVDLLLSGGGLRVSEITTRPMTNVIAMYRTPAYKWMALHAREHGFHPYRREPWHWEFNPPGFQQRFEAETASAPATAAAYGAPLGLFERYPYGALDGGDGYEPPREYDPYAEESGVALQAPPAVDWCAMRTTIANTARAEERRWTAPSGAKLVESQASQLPFLEQYWGAVPGINAATAAARSAANDDNWPWSAAFICYVMHTAGVRRAHGFEFGAAHIRYVVGALRNRERSDTARPFWLLDSIEIVNEVTVEPGDILCMNRRVNGAMTTHSYDSLRRAYWENGHENVTPGGSSHCTLVVGIGSDATGRFAQTIGGNENQSVRLNNYGRIAINAGGGIANPAAHNIYGLIKLTGCNR